MSNTLLPCPFCGGEATVGANEYYDGANTFYTYCTNCGVQQITTKIRTDEAIAAWNRRAQPGNEPLTMDELREELERLEELATATNGDVEKTYTNGYRWGHRNGQIELLRRILNIGDGTCESECHKPERSEG